MLDFQSDLDINIEVNADVTASAFMEQIINALKKNNSTVKPTYCQTVQMLTPSSSSWTGKIWSSCGWVLCGTPCWLHPHRRHAHDSAALPLPPLDVCLGLLGVSATTSPWTGPPWTWYRSQRQFTPAQRCCQPESSGRSIPQTGSSSGKSRQVNPGGEVDPGELYTRAVRRIDGWFPGPSEEQSWVQRSFLNCNYCIYDCSLLLRGPPLIGSLGHCFCLHTHSHGDIPELWLLSLLHNSLVEPEKPLFNKTNSSSNLLFWKFQSHKHSRVCFKAGVCCLLVFSDLCRI